MSTIILSSLHSNTGNTAIAVGLALRLADKLSSVVLVTNNSTIQLDTEQSAIANALSNNVRLLKEDLSLSARAIALNLKQFQRDTVIIDGVSGNIEYNLRLAEETDGRVLLICNHQDDITESASYLGYRLAGVVYNRLPPYRVIEYQNRNINMLKNQGIVCFGAIGEDRRLLSPTLEEVKQHLNGEYVSRTQNGNTLLIDNFMIGGMILDWGPFYFNSRENTCVIVRGDRPDIQLAALQSNSVRALVVSKGIMPTEYALYEADTREIPIVVVSDDTLEVAEKIDTLKIGAFLYTSKIAVMQELIGKNIDIKQIENLLTAPATG